MPDDVEVGSNKRFRTHRATRVPPGLTATLVHTEVSVRTIVMAAELATALPAL